MNVRALALPLLASSMLSGCGLVFTQNEQLVTFTSEPPGADIIVDGMPVGQTPVQVYVSNRRDHIVTMTSGEESTTCMLGASLGAGWLVLDILLGLIPVIVDAATNGWTTLDQGGCHAYFRTSQHAPEPGPVSVR